MGASSLHTVVYIKGHVELDARTQQLRCIELAQKNDLLVVAWVERTGAKPMDAIRSIEVGEADILLVAHPDVLGPPRAREPLIRRVERAGGAAWFASMTRALPAPPPHAELAVSMRRQGLRPEQIAQVLHIPVARTRELLRRAGKGVGVVVAALAAWAQERAGRLAVGTMLAAGLVVGESAWQIPPSESRPTPPPLEQQDRPAGRIVRAPAPPVSTGTPAPRPSTPPVSVPSRMPSPSSPPPPTASALPVPLPSPSLGDCLASPLSCTSGLLPST